MRGKVCQVSWWGSLWRTQWMQMTLWWDSASHSSATSDHQGKCLMLTLCRGTTASSCSRLYLCMTLQMKPRGNYSHTNRERNCALNKQSRSNHDLSSGTCPRSIALQTTSSKVNTWQAHRPAKWCQALSIRQWTPRRVVSRSKALFGSSRDTIQDETVMLRLPFSCRALSLSLSCSAPAMRPTAGCQRSYSRSHVAEKSTIISMWILMMSRSWV